MHQDSNADVVCRCQFKHSCMTSSQHFSQSFFFIFTKFGALNFLTAILARSLEWLVSSIYFIQFVIGLLNSFFYLDIYIPFLFVIYGPFGPLFGLLFPFSFMTSISKSFFYFGFYQEYCSFFQVRNILLYLWMAPHFWKNMLYSSIHFFRSRSNFGFLFKFFHWNM